jgi:hypothetical protein
MQRGPPQHRVNALSLDSGGCDEAVLHREQRGTGTSADTGLAMGGLHLMANRLGRNAQAPCDLLVGTPACRFGQDLGFAGTQPGW